MNHSRFTAGMLLLFAGADLVRSADAPNAPPAESRGHDRVVFLERMKRVKKGWPEKQVLELAGEPKERSGGQWFYKWIESSRGGYYEIFVFTMKDGRVAKIEYSFGCEIWSPAL